VRDAVQSKMTFKLQAASANSGIVSLGFKDLSCPSSEVAQLYPVVGFEQLILCQGCYTLRHLLTDAPKRSDKTG